MHRRRLLQAAGLLPWFGLASSGRAATRARRPNILMVVTDQERHWCDLPAALPLPGHEWLRARGTAFLNHHVHTTPCSPSRSTIYTGMHAPLTGMISNFGAPPYPQMKAVPTIGHHLRTLGYYTAYKGKWHLSQIDADAGLGYGAYPSTRDALEPFGFSDYNDDGDPHGSTWAGFKYDPQTASKAVHWLHTRGRQLKGRQPWFMAVNFVNPHDVMFYGDEAGQQDSTRLRKDYLSPLSAPPVAGVYADSWNHLDMPVSFSASRTGREPWAQQSFRSFCESLYGHVGDDEAAWRDYQSYYFNCIRDADQHLLTVLKGLESSDLLDDTVIVFTADHGEMAGAHRLRQKGPFMFKENVRVPLIIAHPEARHRGETQSLSSAMDLVPTLIAIAGGDPASIPALKGVDLSPVVEKPEVRTARDERGILFFYDTTLYIDPAFVESMMTRQGSLLRNAIEASIEQRQWGVSLEHPGFFRGMHDGRYKFARYFAPAHHHVPQDWQTLDKRNELELFDVRQDPHELHNIAYDPALRETVLALNQRLNALIDGEVGVDDGSELPGPRFLYS